MKKPLRLQLAFSCVFFAFSAASVSAQDILWEKSYGGQHAEYLFDAIPTPDYGFILAGSSLSKKTGNKDQDNRGDLDYWVWKMDEKGDLDWQKSFGGSGQDMLYAVLLTNDGGYLLAGSSESGEGLDKKGKCRGNSDFWVIKLDAKGGELWQKTIGGSGQDELTAVVRAKDGGFILAGSSASEVSGDKTVKNFGGMDYWVVKLDAHGELVWQHSFGGSYNDELRGITTTSDGGYLLGGSSNSADTGTKTQKNLGQSDYWVVKIDDKGEEQWQRTIGGSGDDQLAAVCTTKDGNYLLGGNSNSESSNDKRSSNESGTDMWVVKLDRDTKQILWQQTYNIAKTDILTSLVENEDRTVLIGGYAQGEPVKKQEARSRKQDMRGKIGEARSKKQEAREKGQESLVRMKKGTDDYVAVKVSEQGDELWRRNIGSEGQEVLRKVVETRDGGYLLAGTSKMVTNADGSMKATGDKSSGKGSNDFWVVKLKDKSKPKEDKRPVEAIPNPAMDFTNVIVGYDYNKGTATVVDLAGHTLQQFAITDRTIPIDLQGLPEGIYIVNIKTDKGSDGVKIIKQRNRN